MGEEAHAKHVPKCLNLASWRLATNAELLNWLDRKKHSSKARAKPALLMVRQQLLPVDVYCYLKARFGEPNGFQNWLRTDTSDNWIHWDYHLKSGDQDIYLCGMSREVHFVISEGMSDENWRDLILALKADYGRVGKQKSAVLKSLEHWVTFPNKFVQIANVWADLHAGVVDNIGGYKSYKMPSYRDKRTSAKGAKAIKLLSNRAAKLYQSCLQLSLLTPVLAEAFINMVVQVLCKPKIRRNKRQFDEYVRSQIDVKLFDMYYKCDGFARPIDQHSEEYKNFKRVMDKRNNAIHGNCDPERDKIESVYFEGKRPLFAEAGDHIGKLFEKLESMYEPMNVIKNYEDTHAFLQHILGCLKPEVSGPVTQILETHYPGFDLNRKIIGRILPDEVMTGHVRGTKYDDELAVSWEV